MDINYLNLLMHFKTVAQCLNYNTAGLQLGISYSGLTKSIRALEQYLGVKLFKKSRWNIALTPEGKIFLDRVHTIFEEIQKAELSIKGKIKNQSEITYLTILTTTGLANDSLYQILPIMRDLYPNLVIHLLASTFEYSLDNDKFDIYIGPKIENFSGFNIKKITNIFFKYCAVEKYKDKFGLPKTIDDLKNHRLVLYSSNKISSFTEINKKHNHTNDLFMFSTNSYLAELNLVKSGEAIGLISPTLAKFHKIDVIDIFENESPVISEIYIQHKNIVKKEIIEKIFSLCKKFIIS
jgi:DNA-binding transcriptional LysR family regulator